MPLGYYFGRPGLTTEQTTQHRKIFRDCGMYLTSGRVIDATQSRDPGNTGDLGVLRAGLLMGKITSATFGTVGQYAPSIIGVLQSAYTSGGTEMTVTAAQAVELNRIAGSAGTSELVCIGPPSAAGTVAVTALTHSGINTSTGVITISDAGVNKIAGSFIAINDGRYTPLTFISDLDYGIRVTDENGDSYSSGVDFPKMPTSGEVDSSQLLPVWPSDTSLQAWIVDALSAAAGGKFVFDHRY